MGPEGSPEALSFINHKVLFLFFHLWHFLLSDTPYFSFWKAFSDGPPFFHGAPLFLASSGPRRPFFVVPLKKDPFFLFLSSPLLLKDF